MWRAILETSLLFMTPFVCYALFHALQRRWPFVREFWHGRILSLLTIGGLLIAIGGILLLRLGGYSQGEYVPAHVENGKLVPGRFK